MSFELYRGDCLDVMKDIPDGSVDMVLTDPPYGTTACKWDSIIPLEPMWEQLNRIIKPNGAIVMTASQPPRGSERNPGLSTRRPVACRALRSGLGEQPYAPTGASAGRSSSVWPG